MPCTSPSSYSFAVLSAFVMLLAALPAQADPGDFDPTFAGDGIVENASASQGYDVAIQSDGKILVAAGDDFAVFRYDAAGNLDPDFGTAGRASADFGGLDESARALTIAPDGKILVAGHMRTGSSVVQLAIARFDSTGTLDPTFGTGGITSTDVPGSGFTHAMVRLPSGRTVLASNSDLNNGLLVAYDDDGNLDAGFGMGGVVAAPGITLSALTVAGDAIVAAGAEGTAFGDGAVVARFGFDGTAGEVTTFASDASAGAIAIDPAGRLVVAGSTNGCMDTFVARLFADGALDPDFGTDGVATLDIVPVQANLCAEIGTAVTLQPDGKILVATHAQMTDTPPSPLIIVDWFLSRLDPDGARDLAFDDSSTFPEGHVYIQDAAPAAMVTQGDGKVVTVGRYERPDYDNLPFIGSDLSLALTRNEAMTTPICTAAPRNDCDAAAPKTSALKIKAATAPKKPQLSWCSKKGSATAGDFGDPTTGGSYALCLYDGTNALVGMTQVEGGGTCGTKPCWKGSSTKGWSYANKRGTSYGVGKAKIKLGAGNAVLCVQGKHANLPVVPLPATLPLRAQFQTSAGSCFDATYGTAVKNDASQLTAKN